MGIENILIDRICPAVYTPIFSRRSIGMNSDLDFIFKRRSVRKYTDKTIPAEILRDLLEAGMAAPSAAATDPWHFIVITERETLSGVAAFLPHGKMLLTAPAAIVACGDMTKAFDGYESYMLQDVSAAVENILLAAQALGLGACWLGASILGSPE